LLTRASLKQMTSFGPQMLPTETFSMSSYNKVYKWTQAAWQQQSCPRSEYLACSADKIG